MKRILLIISRLLLALIILNSCNQKQELPEKEKTPKAFCLNEKLKQDIVIDTLKYSEIVQHINLTGEIDFNPNKIYEFTGLISGTAEKVLFSFGDYVRKGQLMAEIKSQMSNELLSDRNSLNAQIIAAQREYEAVQSMYDSNLSSGRELANARAEVDKLKAEKNKLTQSLTFYKYNRTKDVFEVRAPASGYVVDKNVNTGMQINEGQQLFTISNLEDVWVKANVYAADIPSIKEGMNAKIKILSYPEEIFTGKITSLPKVFDTNERVLKARISMDNPNFKLNPGMLTDVKVEKKTGKRAIAVPADEVIFDNNQYYVVLYRDDCDLEVRKVNITSRNEETYFVEEGLKEGELIITQNQLMVYERLY